MGNREMFLTTNLILYCKDWEKTVRFYERILQLEINFASNWFIEFSLNAQSRLSIADQDKSSITKVEPKGITITLQVQDIDKIWSYLFEKNIDPTPIKHHPWNARTFFIFDPEGHRIEIWQSLSEK